MNKIKPKKAIKTQNKKQIFVSPEDEKTYPMKILNMDLVQQGLSPSHYNAFKTNRS